jgi:glycine cleavage system T protein (aminomethyltransferase)
MLQEKEMQKTPLYGRHVQLGAKLIDFGGWAMPVQYTNVITEHRTTRDAAGLFDICHMGEIDVKGPGAFGLLQCVMSRNLECQEIGQMKLSILSNRQGGIIDDLTVYKFSEDYYRLVTNAVTKDKDLKWIRKIQDEKGFQNAETLDVTEDTGKLDIQGPLSEAILQRIMSDPLAPLRYYHSMETKVLDAPAIVSRSGYTGEDGFEIYVSADRVGDIWDALLEAGKSEGIKPIGLGARDTLRLESGMMLYGNEMCETVSPFEVVYGWVTNLEKDFIGRDSLMRQKNEGVKRKLVGFVVEDRGIARHGYKVFKEGQEIGEVTSGTFSPTLQKAIGLAFVPVEYREPGTSIDIQIRDNFAKSRVVPLPFYKRKKK